MTAELTINFGGVPLAAVLGETLAAGLNNGLSNKRLRNLSRLQTSIARVGFLPPTLAATLPTIGTPTASTAIATGKSWQVMAAGVDVDRNKFTLSGGNWANNSASFPDTESVRAFTYHVGNGTDPTVNFVQGIGRARFCTAAPKFEIWTKESQAVNGYRLYCNGKLIAASGLSDGSQNYRYRPLTWGDGTATYREDRNYELEFGADGHFVGIRTENIYRVQPWPVPDDLRILVHGDSFLQTISDSGSINASSHGSLGAMLGPLLGQANVWVSGVGGTGWVNSSGGTKNTFNQRVTLDVVTPAPDIVIDLGGGNDDAVLAAGSTTQAQYQTLVTTWVATILAAKPDTIIFMSGPLIVSSGGSGHQIASTVKAAVAALYPKNVVFFNTVSPADPWVSGTGKQGTTTADGNADWVRGPDNSHPTIEGVAYLATRIVRAMSGAIKTLIDAQ